MRRWNSAAKAVMAVLFGRYDACFISYSLREYKVKGTAGLTKISTAFSN
jgi:hypothetical protein